MEKELYCKSSEEFSFKLFSGYDFDLVRIINKAITNPEEIELIEKIILGELRCYYYQADYERIGSFIANYMKSKGFNAKEWINFAKKIDFKAEIHLMKNLLLEAGFIRKDEYSRARKLYILLNSPREVRVDNIKEAGRFDLDFDMGMLNYFLYETLRPVSEDTMAKIEDIFEIMLSPKQRELLMFFLMKAGIGYIYEPDELRTLGAAVENFRNPNLYIATGVKMLLEGTIR